MKRFSLPLVCLSLLVAPVCAQPAAKPAEKPATPVAVTEQNANEVGSYGIGMNVGRGMKDDGLELNLDAFVQGIRDALDGKDAKYTEAQLREAFKFIQQTAQAKKDELSKTAGDKNRREGEAFLAGNKKKEGVKITQSGLQYEVLRAGDGPSPKASDTVRVHYEGTLLDGTVFDSSIKRQEPAEFPVGGVIPGWTEALQLMKVGDRWKLYIPSDLAYGARGAGGRIGPHSVLTFEVELLGIQPAQK